MKVSVKKEITISSATIANELIKNSGVLEDICANIRSILREEYNVDWDSAEEAVADLLDTELAEIIELMAKQMKEDL